MATTTNFVVQAADEVVDIVIYDTCEAEAQTNCFETEKKTCLKTTSPGREPVEECHVCSDGYITSLTDGSTCVAVDGLNLADYTDVYHPFWFDDDSTGTTPIERLDILINTGLTVSSHNAENPPPLFDMSLNPFSAHTTEEHLNMLGFKPNEDPMISAVPYAIEILDLDIDSLPTQVNWVTKGAVTSVKNQEQCAASYAMAATAAIEGLASVTDNGEFHDSLSWQQILSCDSKGDLGGCRGGTTHRALSYAARDEFGGLASDLDYPFVDQDGGTVASCDLETKNHTVSVALKDPLAIIKYNTPGTPETRMQALMQALSVQPVAIALRANCVVFQEYSSGILNFDEACKCTTASCLDHAVLLVGYNMDHSPPYWIIKNSWGKDWGEDGYARILMNANNNEDHGPFGLFGMLAQGLIPGEATQINPQNSGAVAVNHIMMTTTAFFMAIVTGALTMM